MGIYFVPKMTSIIASIKWKSTDIISGYKNETYAETIFNADKTSTPPGIRFI